MSTVVCGSSSHSTRNKKIAYDVFISFNRKDTYSNFTSHLHSALCKEKIKAFIDDDDLEKGNEKSPALSTAIEESKLCLVILSENYASSRRCLEELVHIFRCKKTDGHPEILPVFYKVDPSDVRKQQNSYAVDFARDEKLQTWREALTEIANLSGWNSKEFRSEAKLIDTIVEVVLKKLDNMSMASDDTQGLVGVVKRVNKIEELLHLGSLNVDPIGIWGTGGIGKTTLARAVCNRLAFHFETYVFLEKVREKSKDDLKKELFSKLLEGESRPRFARDRIRCKKVLVVFDDVDDAEQCGQFITGGWFGPESRIIIISRDKQVLRNIGVMEPYEVEGLDYVEALELFSLRAFKKNSPTTDREELSNRAVHYTGGIPLALIVLGRHLFSRDIKFWESALDKLEKFPNETVERVLRISYDALDYTQKEIFLDIALVLKGEKRDLVQKILDDCDLYATEGIEVLIDKALITIGRWNTVQMHNLLQTMAFEIVRPQSSNQDPRKGSRLWNGEDIYEALKNDRGLETIEGIFLDTSKCNQVISLLPTTFLKMCRLRLLIINGSNLCLPQGPPAFPDTLRYIKWVACPLKSLSTNFIGENLVALEMIGSQLEKLWDGAPNLGTLKSINLSGSLQLTHVPDLSGAPNIESVNLLCCASLTEVPSYFQHLTKLEELTLIGCPSLSKLSGLPKSLIRLEIVTRPLDLVFYRKIEMRDCRSWFLSRKFSSKLERFPRILEPMGFLVTLYLDFAAIKELPLSITNLTGLKYLSLRFCQNLEFLPDCIHSLSSLKALNISFCRKLESLPLLPSSLLHIDARGCTSLKTVPNSIPLMVKQNWDDHSLRDCQYEEFKYFGCDMLDENARRVLMEEALFRILRFATFVSKYGSDEITFCKISNRSCWPGSEIPSWFSHKSEGSSILGVNLPHPDQWYDSSSYLGLAVCLILRLDYRTDRGLAGYWHSTYKFPNDDSRKKVNNLLPNDDSKYLPLAFSYEESYSSRTGCHILPIYNETSEEKMDGAFISETVFVFVDHTYGEYLRSKKFPRGQVGSASFFFDNRDATVMKCGVRFLYRQDAERFGYVRQVDLSESSGDQEAVYSSDQDEEDEEDDDNGGGESDSSGREAIYSESDDREEDKPLPKRIRT